MPQQIFGTWRVLAICGASLAVLWLAPRDGPLPPGLIGMAILALGLVINSRIPSRSASVHRSGQHSSALEKMHSDDSDVRVTGIRELERQADEFPDQRQQAVHVLCDYLRVMGRSEEHIEVRRIAQDALISHLRTVPEDGQGDPGLPRFWPDMNVDLSGATLHDWDMSECRVHQAAFKDAQFDGGISFSGTRFDYRTTFYRARFSEKVAFDGAQFHGIVMFQYAHFHDDAVFNGTRFHTWNWISSVRFDGNAVFDGAWFDRLGIFKRTRFGGASFNGTRFCETATFKGAQLDGKAFDRETVLRHARFDS